MKAKVAMGKPWILAWLLIISLVLWAVAAGAEVIGDPAGGLGFQRANRAAIERLKKMTPAQVRALDRQLAAALKLYYDKEYPKALPALKAVAAQVETLDLMFWIGRAAFELKRYQQAEKQFKKMLAVDPALHRVRLELATVYYRTGRVELAQQELLRVKKARPPKAVLANIEHLLDSMEKQGRRLEYAGRFSTGLMWDSNASFGPELKQYEAPGGTLTPAAATAKTEDWAYLNALQFNLSYDPGKRGDLMWVGGLSLYNQVYFQESAFNYQMADLSLGPAWAGQNFLVRLPVGYTYRYYGNHPLSQTWRAEPSLHYYFGNLFSLRGEYSFSLENYTQASRQLLDNHNHRVELAPTLHFFKRTHSLSFLLGWEDHQADAQRYAYRGPYAGLAYYASLAHGRELYLKYQWTRRDYQGEEPFFGVGRLDRRHSLLLVASQRFWERMFASLSMSYVQNGSNVDIYDLDRFTVSLSLGILF